MPTLKEYLDNLMGIATTGHDPEFAKAMKGAAPAVIEQAMRQRQKSLKKFLEHHICTGTFNGSPIWRRLPSYYDQGKRYTGEKLRKLRAQRGVGRPPLTLQ